MTNIKQPKIGLALGSGGPKGLAHIGVIKVLKENNIPIDFIAGSSIGAMIGGFYAATKDVKQMEKIALGAGWRLILSLIDPSLRQGLVGGEKVKNFIESHINKIHFQDLKIPLSAVATDLKSGEAIVINKGEVASAIRASISFPLVFKPIEQENKLLADGGLSLPVPVDIVKKMGAELIIAVNLDADYFTNGNNKNINFGFYKIANNSINLLRHHLASSNVRNANIVINPQLGNIHWDKFLDGKDIILAGEKAMKDRLNQLQELIRWSPKI
ncbi:patatin-like phospholipase family protein [Candidatus Parcubacteria bacterium]|nr:patatin-like phospholipase family protein [Candidatus Parcubacteria bacterium]